jgi:phosphate transporter
MDKKIAKAMKVSASNAALSAADEMTPLSAAYAMDDGSSVNDDDFFVVLQEQMSKISKFFVGKLAELRIGLDIITNKRRNSYRTHHAGGDASDLTTLRDIYVELAALKSFGELNKSGLIKIIKKYDKILEKSTLDGWIPTIERLPFATSPEPLQLMEIVTNYVSRDKLIEWERFATEAQSKTNDDVIPAVRLQGLIFSVVVFVISLVVPMVSPSDPAASKCMSLLLFTICMWITEAIPYFATALLIPPLVVFLKVLKDDKNPLIPMSTENAATYVLNHMFNHTTFLLLGGYTISTAFSRCQLELRIAALLQKRFGDRPKVFILAVMFLGLFLSMWIGNHTAPILCSAIILPVVRDMPTDSRFARCLLLALAFACNFGGMMTPISSLQNVLAVSYLENAGISISFGTWMLVSIPFCVVCVLLSWSLLLLVFQPDDLKAIPIIVYERKNTIMGKRNVAVLVLSLLCIALFASSSLTKSAFGDIGIVSLLYITVMFGSGMLTEVK